MTAKEIDTNPYTVFKLHGIDLESMIKEMYAGATGDGGGLGGGG